LAVALVASEAQAAEQVEELTQAAAADILPLVAMVREPQAVLVVTA
jgi:hypothetical protein